jgi:hypothetical protein
MKQMREQGLLGDEDEDEEGEEGAADEKK